jgi:branched-chain amino acid transport system substrate-binding protein
MNKNQRAVSTSLAIVLLVVGVVVGAVAGYAASAAVSPSKSSSSGPYANVCSGNVCKLGDLVALSGDLASYGANSKVAVDMAVSDVNAWLKGLGSPLTFQVQDEDTKTDPATALSDLQSMASSGIQVYIGPMTSAEVTNVVSYSNTNHLVLISQSSTAQSLANESARPYLYRFVPSDNAQSAALAALVYQRGVKNVEVVNRNDAWGTGLSAAFISSYKALGGNVINQVQYTPISTGSYDFTSQLNQMQSDLSHAPNGTAIVAVMFDELSVMMQQANANPSAYSFLGKTTWYGTDGTAESSTVVSQAGNFGEKVELLSTIYEPTNSTKGASFTQRFVSAKGNLPDAYSYAAYDATWVAALTILACGTYSGLCVQKELPTVASNYFGVSGYPDLNSAGDRAIADYAIWAIVPVSQTNSSATWEQVGTWSSSTGLVSYTRTI